ncbi:MAG: hypothetical protein WBP94_19490 [Rhodomicrobiaceae bacterium]
MAKNHTRGVNDIPSRMSLSRGNSGRSRSATLLARLEQQKSLLEKQLHVWAKQKAVTEERLRTIGAQIRAVQNALKVPRSAPAAVTRRSAGRSEIATAPKRAHTLDFTF